MTLSFQFWQRSLLAACLLIAGFGLALSFFNQTAAFDAVFGASVNRAFGLDTQPSPYIAAFQRWIYGVLGAIVAGWGIMMAFIAAIPFKRGEPWSWTCIASGLALWFAVDTAISLYLGVIINVLVNCAVLLAIGVPLAATRSHFTQR